MRHPMNLFKTIFLTLLATMLIQGSVALADCGAAVNLPAGSYRQSCDNCVASGGDLTAVCKKMNSQYNTSTVFQYKTCRSGIENLDGYLTCSKGDGALPGGSYKASCRNLNVEKNTLYATCRNVRGSWKEASLPLGYCNYEIYNTDGALACTLPYGTYQRSCRGARVVNGQLYAECKNRSGGWASTSVAAACGRDLSNDDGRLKCL
ncbi:MAG: CVNH domain-containing protein [Bryobacteraceae bacterium]|nr:CVNH domain-containing protein [Bryobacteraceae bacterium]